MIMEKTLKIDDKVFELVVVQREGDTAVYRGGDQYLRVGNREKIERDLKLHHKMEEAGLPVASVISDGEWEGNRYFIEKSLGEKRFRDVFEEDAAENGAASDENFEKFLKISEKFTRAQVKTAFSEKDFEGFARGIHLDFLCAELPEQAEKIRHRFEEVAEKLKVFPFVITHGDLNPSNMYPDGVIDLEDSFRGPFGYDLVSSIVTVDYVPLGTEYEFHAKYRFTSFQKGKYFKLLDQIATENNLPPISNFADDFEFCRAVWLTVRMHKWPKMQRFRYDLFTKKFL